MRVAALPALTLVRTIPFTFSFSNESIDSQKSFKKFKVMLLTGLLFIFKVAIPFLSLMSTTIRLGAASVDKFLAILHVEGILKTLENIFKIF